MADLTKMAASEIAEEHAAEAHAPYLKVWAVLAILTAVEYVYASAFKDFFLVLLLGLVVLGGDQGRSGRLVLHAPEVRGELGVYSDRPGIRLGHDPRLGPDARHGDAAGDRRESGRRVVVCCARGRSVRHAPRFERLSAISGRCGRAGACRERYATRAPHGGRPNVTKSYRLGVQVVLGTVFISASWCLATVSRAPSVPARAGQDVEPGRSPWASSSWSNGRGEA